MSPYNLPQHSYEEIREVVVDILLKRVKVHYEPTQFGNLVSGVGEVFAMRRGETVERSLSGQRVNANDAELARDVFWDLFRQGFITLGLNDSNPQWPWFRLSYFGERTLGTQSPYRFHDTGSFPGLVRNEIPDISSEAITYLEEAVAAFYAGCLLACSVMLGVAAEAEFLRLVEVAENNATHGTRFRSVAKQQAIRRKITAFQDCLRPIRPGLPHDATEDLDVNFQAVQSVLRIARNEAGHPTGATPQREIVYVYLQLFIPFARQLMRLRTALA